LHVLVAIVLGKLTAVMIEDAVMRKFERRQRLGIDLGPRARDLGRRDFDA
jgi:hypothetical protein